MIDEFEQPLDEERAQNAEHAAFVRHGLTGDELRGGPTLWESELARHRRELAYQMRHSERWNPMVSP